MKEKLPETLFVTEKHQLYPCTEITYLHGDAHLDNAVPDNDKDTTVGIYRLISIETYRKVTTRTSVIEKVKP